jgi:hypothetical protein
VLIPTGGAARRRRARVLELQVGLRRIMRGHPLRRHPLQTCGMHGDEDADVEAGAEAGEPVILFLWQRAGDERRRVALRSEAVDGEVSQIHWSTRFLRLIDERHVTASKSSRRSMA